MLLHDDFTGILAEGIEPAAEYQRNTGPDRCRPADSRRIRESGASLPWSLIRVDRADNRIYLSVSGPGNLCTTPTGVQVDETAQTVTIRAVGRSTDGPCTAQKITMIGYVATKAPIDARRIEHAEAR